MHTKGISTIVKEGLCTGCGACAGLCPERALKMVIDSCKGIYLPSINIDKCTDCGLCLRVCPGRDVDFTKMSLEMFGSQASDQILGSHLKCACGFATDQSIRFNSTSGGLVTSLLLTALKERLIDGALVTGMKNDSPLEPQPYIARTEAEIIAAAGSKYCPAPTNVVLNQILQDGGKEKYAVVGLPCHIQAIRKAQNENHLLKERIVLCLGLVCSHADSFKQTEYFLRRNNIHLEDVKSLSYRGRGWPGEATITLKNNSVRSFPSSDYLIYHSLHFFTPHRCHLCADFINRFSDVTFMDAWLPEIKKEDHLGRSIVIVRSRAAKNLLDISTTKGVLQLSPISPEDVVRSQGRSRLSNTDLQVFFWQSRLMGKSTPEYHVQFKTARPTNYLRVMLASINFYLASHRYTQGMIEFIRVIETGWLRKFRNRI